jgi:hypothetical protein
MMKQWAMSNMYIGASIPVRSVLHRGWMWAMSALLAATIVAVFALWASSAHACVLCLPYPKKTSADYIVESDTVVFAREDPARPFFYAPVETLKGHYKGDAIPLLVDSTTSRELRLQPELRVALAQDRLNGTWHRLGLAGSEHQAVMRVVAGWNAKSKTLHERAVFFAPYLRHRDWALAELAFLEVARAPYATIRDLRATVGRDYIYRVINAFSHVEWHGLYILMLGMSDRPDDLAFVRRKLETAAKFGIALNLGAYATAFIEMTGAEAVKTLASRYFESPGRSNAELLEIVNALSVQGNGGRAELRTAIVDAYGLLLDEHLELAGYVAKDLYDWKVMRFVPRLHEILNGSTSLDEASRLAVAMYLSSAGKGWSDAAASFKPLQPSAVRTLAR